MNIYWNYLPAAVVSYSPYGYAPSKSFNTVLGFNGEHRSDRSGLYILGRGVRSFSPSLMRFLSPDPYSPFSIGGLNFYAYCAGDPVNRIDPSGYSFTPAMTQKIHRWRISAQLNVVYRNAPGAKQSLDTRAAGLAERYRGTLITASIKQNRSRVIDNIQRMTVRHPRVLGDIVRNSIVLPPDNLLGAAREFARLFKTKPQVFNGTDAGFHGVRVRSKLNAGIHGETQFLTKQQAFAMFSEDVARPAIGNDLYDTWSSKASAQGFSPGQSHELYEIFRNSENAQSIRQEALAKSRKYWSFIGSLN
ncbi:RHS repeat-associated core domain-containing protein [Pseudomonas sp. NEEL19]|uniref:RHS repeat-associated core domain-containing protein n=1 Tax=Pseudomonas sp. NEEL19 TaxID=2867409 RepID=UPI0023678CE8|nr:RHS repeat-associated core domain-containing protein [Pseudomonas sp. NEEL19]WDM59523.1 RHS repeat-associated core domain-containing protein [Pseudomonas sp. NEEL19]